MSVEVIRDEADKEQFDATMVEGKDPNYHYRWARKDDKNILRHQLRGYEVVERTTERHIVDEHSRIKKGEDTSKAVEWGDMILMRTPKENFEARQGRERSKILRQTKGVAQAYKATIERMSGSSKTAIEEHRDNPSMRRVEDPELSAAALQREMDALPEQEGPRIGRR